MGRKISEWAVRSEPPGPGGSAAMSVRDIRADIDGERVIESDRFECDAALDMDRETWSGIESIPRSRSQFCEQGGEANGPVGRLGKARHLLDQSLAPRLHHTHRHHQLRRRERR